MRKGLLDYSIENKIYIYIRTFRLPENKLEHLLQYSTHHSAVWSWPANILPVVIIIIIVISYYVIFWGRLVDFIAVRSVISSPMPVQLHQTGRLRYRPLDGRLKMGFSHSLKWIVLNCEETLEKGTRSDKDVSERVAFSSWTHAYGSILFQHSVLICTSKPVWSSWKKA